MSEYRSIYADENSYLAFRYRDYDFLIPLADVVRVEASGLTDAQTLPGVGAAKCCIIYETGGRPFAIGADEVYGLFNIPVRQQYELPPEVRTADNQWIFGAAYLEDGVRTAYMLDGHALAQRLAGEGGGGTV